MPDGAVDADAAPGVGVGGTTANGLAGAQQLLDDWCAMTAMERQEAIAFYDWYSPNIQP